MAEENDKKITNPSKLLAESSETTANATGESTAQIVKALSPLQSIAASIREGFTSFGKKLDQQVGATKVSAEGKVEAARAAKAAEISRKKRNKFLSDLWKNSRAMKIANAARDKAAKVMKNHWGKFLLLGLFFIKKETWVKIGESALKVFNLLKEIDWAGVFETLGNAIVQIVDFLIPIFEWFGKKLFGEKTKEEDYKKQQSIVDDMVIKDADGKFAGRKKETNMFGMEESDADWEARYAEEKKKLAGMGSYETNEKTGKEEFKGKRQGGLFGENRGIMDIIQGAGAAILAFGLLFAPGATLMMGFKALSWALGKIPKLPAIKTTKVPGTQKLGKGLKKPPNWEKMSKTEQKTFNKKAGAKLKAGGTPKAGGAPKVSTPKVPGQKLLTSGGGGGAPKVSKPPSTSSKLMDTGKKMGKWAGKFPKLAKSMKFLTKIPFIGKAFLAGPLIYALASGAGKEEIAPIIGQIFGGVGGASLGAMLGGMIGIAGGPLALVTGALGGVAGAMVGDTLGTAMAQWLVGTKVDAFPDSWYAPFGWINDIMNGGKGPSEGGGAMPAAPAAGGEVGGKPPSDIGGGKPPMSKNQFLQSENYKGQMRGEDGVVAGESTAGKNLAFENYLKGKENLKNNPDKKIVDRLIDETRARSKLNRHGKPLKGKSGMAKTAQKRAMKREWGKFGRALEKFDPEWRQLALDSLDKDELRYIKGKEASAERSERSAEKRASMTQEQRDASDKRSAASTGSSAGDAMFEERIITPAVPRVSPQDKTAALKQGTDKMLDGKSSQQGGNVTVVKKGDSTVSNTSSQQTVIAQNPATATKDPFWDESF